MKVGELNMHCGECRLIDHCGEPYSEIIICMANRFKDVEEEKLYELLETSTKKSKTARLNDAHRRLKKVD